LKYCPDGYRKSGGGVCELKLHCDSSKYNNCPPTKCILDKDCPPGFTCSDGYNREGINGDCGLKIPCDSSKGKCPSDTCNVFKGDCKPERTCINNSTNSTDTSCYEPMKDKPKPDCSQTLLPIGCSTEHKNQYNKPKGSSSTDSVIKYYITNPIIQKQVAQQPSNVLLIPIDTIQFCI